MTELLIVFRDLLDVILSSPNPSAALQRAKVAAETEAANVAADTLLEQLPSSGR